MSERCGIEYPDLTPPEERKLLNSLPDAGIDRTPVICFREVGHCGSHVAERAAHVTIWDGEMYYDFYAPYGFEAVISAPQNGQFGAAAAVSGKAEPQG